MAFFLINPESGFARFRSRDFVYILTSCCWRVRADVTPADRRLNDLLLIDTAKLHKSFTLVTMGKEKVVQAFTHPQRVRLLYKTILKLHRGLPHELQAIGDQYTKDEFRRHKEASPEQAQTFMVEWTNYAVAVAKQLGIRGTRTSIILGEPLRESDLHNFNDEQIHQLYELYEAAALPVTDETNKKS